MVSEQMLHGGGAGKVTPCLAPALIIIIMCYNIRYYDYN